MTVSLALAVGCASPARRPGAPLAFGVPARASRSVAAGSTATGDAGTFAQPDAAADAVAALRVPDRGCDPSWMGPEGFRDDLAALRTIGALVPSVSPNAVDAGRTEATEASETRHVHGHVAWRQPSAWFASRDRGEAWVSYAFRTGDPSDSMGLYIGRAPPVRPPRGLSIALRGHGYVARGSVASVARRFHLDLLFTLACASPRYVYLWGSTADAARFAALVATARTIEVMANAGPEPDDVTLEAGRDRAALLAMTQTDALARRLAVASIDGDGMRAPYPLPTVHPHADQVLVGRFGLRIGPARVSVAARLPVERGVATAPSTYAGLFDASFEAELRGGVSESCPVPNVTVEPHTIEVRCDGRDTVRAEVLAIEGSRALANAIRRVRAFYDFESAWSRSASRAGGWPRSLCASGDVRLNVHDGAVIAVRESCTLVLDRQRDRWLALATEGDCARVPTDTTGTRLRTIGRFAEVTGTGRTFCNYAFGALTDGAWLLAAGDEGSSSGPVARGPSPGVDRRAVAVAIAFVPELLRFVLEQTPEAPSNVRPSVLAALGVASGGPDAPAAERVFDDAAALVRWILARGATERAAVRAVLRARPNARGGIEVTMMALTLTLERERNAWIIVEARPTRFVSTPPTATPRSATVAPTP